MRAVARWLPHAVPRVLGEDAKAGWFAMDYLAPEDHPLWKTRLLAGIVNVDFAAAVGRDLAIIHARSAADLNIPAAFANDETFEAIRIEPYLRATGRAHPELAARFDELARTTLTTKRALVHGDISPKNILQGPDGPCSSTPNAPGSAIPPSILPSASIISCSRARAKAPTGRATSPLFRRWRAPISLASIGRARRHRSARGRFAAGLVPRAGRRQVAGRISHPRERARRRAPLRRTAGRRSAALALKDDRRRLGAQPR